MVGSSEEASCCWEGGEESSVCVVVSDMTPFVSCLFSVVGIEVAPGVWKVSK